MTQKVQCGAFARSTGLPCKCKALKNGRCKLHGGMSTGPKTFEGKMRVAIATKDRMQKGQLEAAKKGYRVWLQNGGRETIQDAQKKRHKKNKLIQADLFNYSNNYVMP